MMEESPRVDFEIDLECSVCGYALAGEWSGSTLYVKPCENCNFVCKKCGNDLVDTHTSSGVQIEACEYCQEEACDEVRTQLEDEMARREEEWERRLEAAYAERDPGPRAASEENAR